MNLISLLQSLFKKRPKPVVHQQPVQATRPEPTTSSVDQPVNDDFFDVPEQSATPIAVAPQPKICHATIHYLDEHNQPLRSPINLTGNEHTAIHLPWLKFTGYYLANIHNLQQNFDQSPITIWLTYLPKMAAPVFVIHRNLDGGPLVKPQLLRGALNEPYQAKPFDGGVNFVQHVSANQTGHFQEKTQTVVFEYDPLNLKYADTNDVRYIQLLASTPVYEKPSQETKLTTQLPKHSIWRLFGTATTTAGTCWYNLGGYWILPTEHELLATNPYLKQTYQVPPQFNLDYQTITAEDVTLQGHILGSTVTLWQAPYIGPVRCQLQEQRAVNLIQVVILDNHSRWYELSNHYWILASLVTVDDA